MDIDTILDIAWAKGMFVFAFILAGVGIVHAIVFLYMGDGIGIYVSSILVVVSIMYIEVHAIQLYLLKQKREGVCYVK